MRRVPAKRAIRCVAFVAVVCVTVSCTSDVGPVSDHAGAAQGTPSIVAASPSDLSQDPNGHEPEGDNSPGEPRAESTDEATGDPTPSQPEPTSAPQQQPSQDPIERGPQGDIVIEAVLEPRCAAVGDAVIVDVTTRPNVGLGIIAQYADGKTHETMTAGETDDQGRFRYRWTIAPGVPPGEAELLIGASNGDEKGSRIEPFRVVDVSGACDD